METTQIVAGHTQAAHLTAVAEHLQEEAIGLTEADHHGVLVGCLQFHHLVIEHFPGRVRDLQIAIEFNILMGEEEVRTGKEVAI